MWRKLFIGLLSLHLLLAAAVAVWYLRLPHAPSLSPSAPTLQQESSRANGIQVEVNQQAVNVFLQQALKDQPEVHRILSNADVTMGQAWNADVGIKVSHGVVPFNVTLLPSVANGQLDLQIANASVDGTSVTDTLVNVIHILPLPHYVSFLSGSDTLRINLAELPTQPFEVRALSYSKQGHDLTVLINMVQGGP